MTKKTSKVCSKCVDVLEPYRDTHSEEDSFEGGERFTSFYKCKHGNKWVDTFTIPSFTGMDDISGCK